MKFLVFSFVVSLAVTLLLVRSNRRHSRPPPAELAARPQNVHLLPVPRLGGLALVAGVVVSVVWVQWSIPRDHVAMWSLVGAALPAFLGGLAEDLTHRVSPRRRLVLTVVSAALGVWLLDAVLRRTDIPGLDTIVLWYPAAVAMTLLAVTGVSNAINIIDGFNGLASMCALFMLMALAYVAYQVDDPFVFLTALIYVGAVLGFFVWNFPAGLIFLGDGGAYFLGFSVAELGIVLIGRNPEVSPLFPLLLCIYPIVETLFSIYRRSVVRGVAAVSPDGIHLHTLIYRRVIGPVIGLESERRRAVRNSMTSTYLWVLCLMSVIPAVLWWQSSAVMALFIGTFAVSYVALYCRILKFRTPWWLKLRR
jgi:UDP-N-acetylmuramyl pentapeptide phosphotransferase/UDP-N-acetylglucosamine-1-phosphate transferase